jgi:hypothetical protein
MPNLIAYDLAGVQPMSGPTGLIFAMRSRYGNSVRRRSILQRSRQRILDNHLVSMTQMVSADAAAGMGTTSRAEVNPSVLNPVGTAASAGYNVGQGIRTD